MCGGGGGKGKPVIDINWKRDVQDKGLSPLSFLGVSPVTAFAQGIKEVDVKKQEMETKIEKKQKQAEDQASAYREQVEEEQKRRARSAVINKQRTSPRGKDTQSRLVGSKFYESIG